MDSKTMYDMIFKRKSFHLFRDVEGSITQNDIECIKSAYATFTPLYSDIKTRIDIVKESDTTSKRGSEYAILMYSEIKDNYLQNIGYLGEQLDLYLASKNIGALWYGIGKVSATIVDDMHFVIMILIAKVNESKFRVDMFKSKRKKTCEVWTGDSLIDIANVAKYAPSACNTQPWHVCEDGSDLVLYRYQKQGKRGIMPKDKVVYYNRIDVGIFMLFLELCLKNKGIEYERVMYVDCDNDSERVKIARYILKK